MKRPAFTLVEMVVVLGLVGAAVIIAAPQCLSAYRDWECQQFYKQLEQQWQAAVVHSRTNRVISTVRFGQRAGKEDVQFLLKGKPGEAEKVKCLDLPADLTYSPGNRNQANGAIGHREWKIYTDGFSKPTTVTFFNRRTGVVDEVRIQMGGVYKRVTFPPGRHPGSYQPRGLGGT